MGAVGAGAPALPLAWDTELAGAVVGLFVQAVFGHLRRVAKAELGLDRRADAHPGAVCMVQRWGGAANLNVHLHAMVADGVFVRQADGTPRFRALPGPSSAAVAQVAWDVCQRVVALLRRRGQWLDADPEDDRLAQREPLLAQLYAASLAGTLVMGPHAGRRQLRFFGAPSRPPDEPREDLRNAYGFDLDARVRVAADDKSGRERLARYMTRPPLSQDRLTRLDDGRFRIRLKRPWRDGTTDIVLDGVELVGRLAALVPPPRAHLTRYFGVFAPRAALRRAVVPAADGAGLAAQQEDQRHPDGAGNRQRRLTWAKLLARVFGVDVLCCPRCSSRMQRVDWCLHPARIAALLSTGPPPSPPSAA